MCELQHKINNWGVAVLQGVFIYCTDKARIDSSNQNRTGQVQGTEMEQGKGTRNRGERCRDKGERSRNVL